MNAERVTPDGTPTRVAIADDAMLLRTGISTVLTAGGCEIVASVGTAAELLMVVQERPVDAVVLDIRMPPTHTDEGIVALETLRAGGSKVGVLLLSMYATPAYAIRAMSAGGGTGYLLKDRVAEPERLVQAVRTVASGGSVVDSEVVAQLVAQKGNPSVEVLTPRERDVLALMAEGKSNSGIASTLFLSLKTVETHIGNIMSKLGIDESPTDHRRVLAVLRLLGQP
ncbi:MULTISPECIES: response regulator transcription factor [unclassified Leifsonia]|uniref:response regulator transcription factor n=1 Tax=unclassified Leifsonia TaxID=2663824 RepID=UPI0006FCB38C|nr:MULTISPECIES: response regulator transcription factor [unclassified Leifsonia]KQX07858.1 LuxR family transcriptional regulator [Leifsonia sp. Root1293]KRA12139.1 LuxR family transcriptional regulator [Leifsonia sp. Root60]